MTGVRWKVEDGCFSKTRAFLVVRWNDEMLISPKTNENMKEYYEKKHAGYQVQKTLQ